MNDWKRRATGILTLGGSSIGLAAIVSDIPILELRGLSLVIVLSFTVLFVAGILIGLLIMENKQRAWLYALPLWALQIPVVSSPLLRYNLYMGAKFDIVFSAGFDIKFEWGGGSEFNFYLHPGDQVAIGVNVLAIIITIWLWKATKTPL